jgi:DNA modification methylase
MAPDGNPAGRNRRSIWTIPTQPFPEAHFATFPEALVEPCILAGSAEGDVVLDPFAGSGTVAVVAHRLRRRSVGIELSPGYLEIAQRRIGASQRQLRLFDPEPKQPPLEESL